MRLWTRICFSGLLPGICCILLRGHTLLAGDVDVIKPAQDIKLALDRYEDGKIKTQLIAGRAKPPVNGDWEAWNIKIEFYDPQGEIESVMTADDCRYSAESGMAKSTSNVRLERKGLVITGTGFEWDVKEQVVKILSDVKVVMEGKMSLMKGIKK